MLSAPVEDDSGWRALTQSRVDDLYEEIVKGQWGKSNLAPPSLLVTSSVSGLQPVPSQKDSLWRLGNGKHCVRAWATYLEKQALTTPETIAAAAGDGSLDCLGAEGKLVVTVGLMCQLVEYDSTDAQDILMHMGVQHDAESVSNTFQQTSLQSKYDIVVAAQARVAGGTLDAAVKLLTDQFGASKKATFWRWAHMRDVLPEQVRVKFDERRGFMPQGYAFRTH